MRIISYNIHSATDENNKLTLDQIINYLKLINSDVICLQEVLYDQFMLIKKRLKINGIFATNVEKPGKKYGICTLSKYNIISNKHIFLTSKKEQRGVLAIKVEYGDINIINTHLGLDRDERFLQISEILNLRASLVNNSLLCGDFNEKNINLSDFNDASVKMKKNNIPTFERRNSRIDYIFVEKNIEIKKYYVDCVKFSDHYPIIVEV